MAIPKTKQTTIVKSSKNDIKTGVMSFLFYGLTGTPRIRHVPLYRALTVSVVGK
jgi:hypothetical protein